MRGLASLFSTVVLATGVAISISLFALPESASGADEEPMSQGSLYKGSGPHPEAGGSSGYSQIVRDSSSGLPAILRGRLGGAGVGNFEFQVPKEGRYSLYARWPEDTDGSARFGVETGDGMEWSQVSPRDSGGKWVELGDYELREGQRRAMQTPDARSGRIAAPAEAVKVVGDEEAAPGLVTDEPTSMQESGQYTTMAATQAKKRQVAVRRARNHIGTRYRLSPPAPCRAYKAEDCSCHTRLVFKKWRTLPDHPSRQYRFHGRKVAKRHLVPGDLVFFRERGRNHPITHVGIYSGKGNLIHASSYYGKVVESKMKYIKGYYGAKRLKL